MTLAQKEIDVEQELSRRAQQRLTGERNTSALSSTQSSFMPGSKVFLALVVGISCLVGGGMLYKVYKAKQTENVSQEKASQPTTVRNTLPALNLKNEAPSNSNTQETSSPPVTPPISDPQPSEMMKTSDSREASPQELLRQRRLCASLTDEEGSSPQAVQAPTSSASPQEGELQQKMQPLRLEASMAGQLGDRHYLLTQGSMIDCVLETRLITTQPGMASCYVTRNIYSANGRVVLLEKGSKVIGHYQGGISQGQARIFVLWSRIETPQGIIIHLDSPGTGPLGEGGVGGYIDTHFWTRFGSALFLSLVDDFSTVATQALASSNNKSQFNFSGTTNSAQDMAAEALKNSIQIPPTLYKNPGERVSIFVARDLNFRSVYELQRR